MIRANRLVIASCVAALLAPPAAWAQAPATPAAAPAQAQPQAAPLKQEQLEQLVAPIALYPDSLVAQVLMACTYPLEVVQAARWLKANPGLKGKALEDALQKQKWDPSVKSLTVFPQVLAMLDEKLDLTQRLGDAFLAQQKDVLDAVQRLRARADQTGNLKSGKEQTVTKAEEGGTTVIRIEPANTETIYVPTYDPNVVYGPWPYPSYPPYYWYSPYYYPYGWAPGAAFVGFTAGIIIGGALWGGCNWGGGGVYVDHRSYNNFNRSNIGDGSGRGNWQHSPEHRKGVGYRDQASREKFGGGERANVATREQFRGRADQGRRDLAAGAADSFRGRGGVSDRTSGAGGAGGGRADLGGRGNIGNVSDRSGMSNRGSGFSGVGSGAQTRDSINRGSASRSSAAGASRGGGFSGGGGRGGGGGGRGGGGRR
ncbi:MAG TPA: DUF3300 domain-containing protein [Ramlibacter sp.]|nr:DUF3300 domain-containing protein [Ramlibacter sp.]